MCDESNTNSNTFAYNSLEELRTRMLDLTRKNILLNYKHPAKSLRFIDTHINEIAKNLYDQKKVEILAVGHPSNEELQQVDKFTIFDEQTGEVTIKKPTAKQWAEHIGRDVSFDAKNGSFKDGLQSIFYANQLENKVRAIKSQAKSSIDEMGVNTLFLTLGFLSWYESEDSEVENLSPLFNIPINIDKETNKRTGVTTYKVSTNGEDIQTNFTLNEKLLNDFGFTIPDIEEDVLPEDYLSAVQKRLAKIKPRWQVKYYTSIVLLNFSKQAMYRDLDPKNWKMHKLEDHPVLSRLFSGDSTIESAIDGTTEYTIDAIDKVHNDFPLVYDADSSQHSALIDAVNGNNIVIEGPPGSGKSQTITNLIASTLNNKQKILFVAEKMAALNVVKSKLDNIGLGGFCLELHSHKANKLQVIQDLHKQLEEFNSYEIPQDYESSVKRYEHYKTLLNDYVALINKPWKDSGRSIHDILNRTTRLRLELDINSDDVQYTNNNPIDDTVIHDALENATIFQKEYTKIVSQAFEGTPNTHPWYGVESHSLMDYELRQLTTQLEQWNDQLKQYTKSWQILAQQLNLGDAVNDDHQSKSNSNHNKTIEFIHQLPNIEENIKIQHIAKMTHHFADIDVFLDTCKQFNSAYRKITSTLSLKVIEDDMRIEQFENGLAILGGLTSNEELTIDDLIQELKLVIDTLQRVKQVSQVLKTMRSGLPSDLQSIMNVSIDGFNEIGTLVEMIEALSPELWLYRNSIYESPSLDVVLPQLTNVFIKLDPLYNSLNKIFDLTKLPETTHLKQHQIILNEGGAFKWFSSSWRASKQAILNLSPLPSVKLSQLEPYLDKLISYSELMDKARSISSNNPIMKEQFQGMDTPVTQAVALRTWYKKVAEEYGASFGERSKIGKALLNMDEKLAFAIKDAYRNNLTADIHSIEQDLTHLKTVFDTAFIFYTRTSTLNTKESALFQTYQQLHLSLKLLKGYVKTTDLTLVALDNINKSLKLFVEARAKVNDGIQKYDFLKEDLPSQCSRDISEDLLDSYLQTLELFKVLQQDSDVFKYIESNPTLDNYRSLKQLADAVYKDNQKAQQLESSFFGNNQVDKQKWLNNAINTLKDVINHNDRALDNQSLLIDWQLYLQSRRALAKSGFINVLECLDNKKIRTEQLVQGVELSLYGQMSKDIFLTHESIREFSSSKQLNIGEKFRDYDRYLLELQRKKIAYNASQTTVPEGNGGSRVADLSDKRLILHEASKQTRHIAVRELLDRASDAIQALKPCFMMSPMSVAQYLQPDNFEFDMVIMDEASQIFPEDAIGAIARGKSIVIVGDPKQLPPSNFFNTALNDEGINDDIVTLQASESILDAVSPIFTNRKLKWHYRSRHQSLIAFSNKQFYDSNLILFPSPFNESDEFGIHYQHVKASFNEGINTLEATEVIELLSRLLKADTGESIGIVAMNSKQRDAIDNLLEVKLKEDPHFNSAYENYSNAQEPIFIKNLENVQGDERDVIIISMTYGPNDIGGKVAQRFGPINQQGGWRRLNVLFTRSRKRMHIISSMHSGDIQSNHDSKKGVRALKAFLEYCETGHLHNSQITGRQPDSDFEISVMNSLKEYGYECSPQLGVAGFFIDLAVRNPNRPEEFIMGVECDGATYHSGKSARDRDRLRQEILEGLGWNIQRIWSTDWFRNPEEQIKRIVGLLDDIVAKKNIEDASTTPSFIVPSDRNSLKTVDNKEETYSESKDLKTRLIELRMKSEESNPKLANNKRLLRDEMIEALILKCPCNLDEYTQKIPFDLRTGTSTEEAKYLTEVFRIIEEYS